MFRWKKDSLEAFSKYTALLISGIMQNQEVKEGQQYLDKQKMLQYFLKILLRWHKCKLSEYSYRLLQYCKYLNLYVWTFGSGVTYKYIVK